MAERWYFGRVWLEATWQDAWVGLYWRRQKVLSDTWLDIYLCILPLLPIHLRLIRSYWPWWRAGQIGPDDLDQEANGG